MILLNYIFEVFTSIHGLWGILMLEIVKKYHGNYDKVYVLCIPILIPSKSIPIIFLVAFLCLGNVLSTLIGLILGYLRKKYLDAYNYLKFTYLSDTVADQIDASPIQHVLRYIPVYVTLTETLENISEIIPQDNYCESLDNDIEFI